MNSAGEVVSFLKGVVIFFSFSREHKLVAQPGQRVFSSVMCGRAGWHCSQSLEPKPDKQTERQQRDFLSERHHPLASDEKTVGCFLYTHTVTERFMNFAHQIGISEPNSFLPLTPNKPLWLLQDLVN